MEKPLQSEIKPSMFLYQENMKAFLALSVVISWLTAFPLQGFLLPEESFFQLFLIFHTLGYFSCYLLYNNLEKNNFFPSIIFIVALLTLLFPFLSYSLKIITISLLGFLSPLILLRSFYLLRVEIYIWPFTGLVLGNFLTLLLYVGTSQSPWVAHFILAFLLISLYFLRYEFSSAHFSKNSFFITINRIDLFYLFCGIFLFYQVSPLLYNWDITNLVSFDYLLQVDLIFYSLGIFLSLAYLKETPWDKKGLFILASTFISLGNTALNFETATTLYLGRFLFFSGTGVMDLIILFLFVRFFKNFKFLTLMYAIISLSTLTSNTIYDYLQSEREYLHSYLAVTSLFSLLFFYRISFKTASESESSEKQLEKPSEGTSEVSEETNIKETKLTPQDLQEKLNQSLEASVKRLSKRECEVLYYYVLENKNLTEIAEILRISRSSAKEYLKRACLKLSVSPYELKKALTELLNLNKS